MAIQEGILKQFEDSQCFQFCLARNGEVENFWTWAGSLHKCMSQGWTCTINLLMLACMNMNIFHATTTFIAYFLCLPVRVLSDENFLHFWFFGLQAFFPLLCDPLFTEQMLHSVTGSGRQLPSFPVHVRSILIKGDVGGPRLFVVMWTNGFQK